MPLRRPYFPGEGGIGGFVLVPLQPKTAHEMKWSLEMAPSLGGDICWVSGGVLGALP